MVLVGKKTISSEKVCADMVSQDPICKLASHLLLLPLYYFLKLTLNFIVDNLVKTTNLFPVATDGHESFLPGLFKKNKTKTIWTNLVCDQFGFSITK